MNHYNNYYAVYSAFPLVTSTGTVGRRGKTRDAKAKTTTMTIEEVETSVRAHEKADDSPEGKTKGLTVTDKDSGNKYGVSGKAAAV